MRALSHPEEHRLDVCGEHADLDAVALDLAMTLLQTAAFLG
jgi:hypothetical protein